MAAPQETSKIVILCLPNLSIACGQECTELGIPPLSVEPLGVTVEGTFADAMRLNLHLRTANRVLWPLAQFNCHHPDQLYKGVRKVGWERILDPDGYFSVHGYVKQHTIRNSQFAGVKVKDGIVDRMRDKTGRRPDTGPNRDQAVVYYRWKDNKCEIFLDTSGETLSKHSYRIHPGKAPLQEALAAAILITTRWDPQTPLVNPMCGSGTLAIEAALMAMNKVPGLMRHNFGFMHVQMYPESTWKKMVLEASRKVNTKNIPKLVATDIRRQAIKEARDNARQAGVDHLIEFEVLDFRKQALPTPTGILVYNPEYGERLGQDKDLEQLYADLGDFLKQKAAGYWAYVFTGNLDLAKKIGLRPKRKTPFQNAKIECRLYEYELYEGTRRYGQED
ncbi:MAG TPA: RNA methyltransferase [Cytophagales bacterium]|nr:RNA methyltransferase [Cytophagales bacterium]